MALQEKVSSVSYEAAAPTGQYILVAVGTQPRQAAIAVVGSSPIGVCLNKPQAAGDAMTVQTGGIAKVRAGAAVPVGSPVGADATGRGIVVAAGNLAVGTAITAATLADQIIEVQLD